MIKANYNRLVLILCQQHTHIVLIPQADIYTCTGHHSTIILKPWKPQAIHGLIHVWHFKVEE